MAYIDEIDALMRASGDIIYRNHAALEDYEYDKALVFLHKAYDIAKENGELQTAFFIKTEIIYAEEFAERNEEMIIDFIWCINNLNSISLNKSIAYNLDWDYKIIVDKIFKFSNVSLDKINYIFENMETFYKNSGASLKPFYEKKMLAAINGVYDEKEIDSLYNEFLLSEADKASDCAQCNMYHKMTYFLYKNDLKSAVKETENILSSKHRCTGSVYGSQSDPLIYLYSEGKYELAKKYHLGSIRAIDGRKGYLDIIWNHIMYLANVDVVKALRVFEKNYKNSLGKNNFLDKLYFDLSAYVLFTKMQKEGINKFKIRIPEKSPIYKDDDYVTQDLINHFKENVINSKSAFDKRNGNRSVSESMNKFLKMCDMEKID